jgi:dolichyl-phosphate-mannose--protein O-mannosyl transferase
MMKRDGPFFHHFHHALRAMARPYRRLSMRAKNKTDEKGTVLFFIIFIMHYAPWRVVEPRW